MKPLIGMLVEIDNDGVTKCNAQYIYAVTKAGGIPILFPNTRDEGVIDRLIEMCDGFLFTGGCDVDPCHYGEAVMPECGNVQPQRDALELLVFKKVFAGRKPILGICRGAQMINIAMGGTLYQDIPTQCPSSISHRQTEALLSPSHSVNVTEGTPLSSLIGQGKMIANSFHHQAIKELGHGLQPMAYAEDGTLEALYYQGERYLRAYQWHPERLVDVGDENLKLLSDFVQIATVK